MLPFSKTLQNNLSHAFTPNIREVMKLYNIGEQSLEIEADFSAYEIECTGNRYQVYSGIRLSEMFERLQNS